jgi:hypothetical protein
MIQRFLDGKKKYTALILTLAAAVVPILIQDPSTQATVMDFVPTVATVIAGVSYIVTQGKIDQEKVKVASANGQAATVPPAEAAAQQVAPAVESVSVAPATAAVENVPLDLKLFHERVLSDTLARHTEQNAATVFYTAKDKGATTTCHDIQQAQDYWDYLVTLVYDAEAYIREITQVDKPGPCKVRSPEHVLIQNEMSKIIRCRDNVYTLANYNVDWRSKLGVNDTLWHIGVLASEMLPK